MKPFLPDSSTIDIQCLISAIEQSAYDPKTKCLIKSLMEKSQKTSKWYMDKRKWPKRKAKCYRILAILLASLAASLPIMEDFKWVTRLLGTNEMLYKCSLLLLALAGLFNFFDRFFGYSASWMRYTKTAIHMESDLCDFAIKLTILINDGTKKEKDILELTSTFGEAIYDAIEGETDVWIERFKNSIADLEKRTAKGKRE